MPVPFVSYFRHIYLKVGPFSYRDGPLEKLWGRWGEFRAAGISSHLNFVYIFNLNV